MELNIIAARWTLKTSPTTSKTTFLHLQIWYSFTSKYGFLGLLLLTLLSVKHTKGQNAKINFYLQSELNKKERTSSESFIHLNVKGDPEWVSDFAKKNGGKIKYQNQDYTSIILPIKSVKEFSANYHVNFIDFSLSKGYALNDSMLVNNNVIPIHNGELGIPEDLTGKDVIIGFIDTGIEFEHEDFKDSTGNTRILTIWDQGDSGDPTKIPPLYQYGNVWDSTDINANNCPQKDMNSHGSTVAGSATGNGRATGRYKGVAPDADIIMVKTNFNVANWLSTVADAVHFIFSKADELNKPCVINASVGDYYGSHDGKDAVAKYIDALLLEKEGRSMVCAAGNSGDEAYHLEGKIIEDTVFSWFKYNAGSALGYGSVFFEVWADTTDFNQISYSVGADKVNGAIPNYRGNIPFTNIKENINKLLTDTLKVGGNNIAIIDYYAELRDNRYLLQVHLAEPDSNQYNFRFITAGTGSYDIWTTSTFGTSNMVGENIPDSTLFPAFRKYKKPDQQKTLVNSWACSPHVITVANYQNRISYIDYNGNKQFVDGKVGDIVDNSSWGPARTGLQKPDIAASGNIAMSSVSFPVRANLIGGQSFKLAEGGMHLRNGGTSMASPVVAGIVALHLQRCPKTKAAHLIERIKTTAKTDGFTGIAPNNRWGYGKINALGSIKKSIKSPGIQYVGNGGICEGDSLKLSLLNSYVKYNWSDSSINSTISVLKADTLSVVVEDLEGCYQYSDTVITKINAKPSIKTKGISKCEPDSLFDLSTSIESSNAQSITFYHNYEDAKGAQNVISDYLGSKQGRYFVRGESSYGCFELDSMQATLLSFPMLPNLSVESNKLTINYKGNYQWFFNNEVINGATDSIYFAFADGWYTARVTNEFNCSQFSDSLHLLISANNLNEFLPENFSIAPNPVTDILLIKEIAHNNGTNFNVQFLDLLGQPVLKSEESLVRSDRVSEAFNLNNLKAGMYLAKICTNKGCVLKKFIKN